MGRKMEVTYLPCQVSGFLLVGIGNPKDRFGLLVYDVVGIVSRVKTNSMPEGRLQIETKVSPIVRLSPPAALGKNSSFHRQCDRAFIDFMICGIECFD